jgi:hypothetical protein
VSLTLPLASHIFSQPFSLRPLTLHSQIGCLTCGMGLTICCVSGNLDDAEAGMFAENGANPQPQPQPHILVPESGGTVRPGEATVPLPLAAREEGRGAVLGGGAGAFGNSPATRDGYVSINAGTPEPPLVTGQISVNSLD